jgi:hypothetical protein
MYVTAHGILTDQAGKVLLHRINPTTAGIVSCPLEAGKLPGVALTLAFRESTGLIIQPVRLTGLYHRREKVTGHLSLVYRCIVRGGELASPDGSPIAGFFDLRDLPPGTTAESRRFLTDACQHTGGPPVLNSLDEGVAGLWRRLVMSPPARDTNQDDWSITSCLVLVDENERVTWVPAQPEASYQLPTVTANPAEAPWAAVEQFREEISKKDYAPVELRKLQIAPERPTMKLVFYSRVVETKPYADTEFLALRDIDPNDNRFITSDLALAREVIGLTGPVVETIES